MKLKFVFIYLLAAAVIIAVLTCSAGAVTGTFEARESLESEQWLGKAHMTANARAERASFS